MMEESIYNDLLEELVCPICTCYLSPPIRQCSTGHNICETCLQRLTNCALCQSPFTESRNISLESLATKMRYPCPYKLLGCDERLQLIDRDDHKAKCTFRGYKCGMEKCTWMGKKEEVSAHWASKKITSKPYYASNVCHTKMKPESFYANIVEAYHQIFWFKCKLTNHRIYWSVQLIGDPKKCQDFYYEIEVFKLGCSRKKIIFSDYCQSIDLDNSELCKDGVSSSVSVDTVQPFVNANQLLVYYMRMHRDVRNPKSGAATQRDRSKVNFSKKVTNTAEV